VNVQKTLGGDAKKSVTATIQDNQRPLVLIIHSFIQSFVHSCKTVLCM